MGPIERELRRADWSAGFWNLSFRAECFVSEVAWSEFAWSDFAVVLCRRPCSTCIEYIKNEGLLADLASYSIEAAEALNV